MTRRDHQTDARMAAHRMDVDRRVFLGGLSALAATAFAGGAEAAEAWPTTNVRIVVPFAPGGPADGSARILADIMAPQLGHPIVVDNRAGAGGVIGITSAAQSKDRHTLLMGSTSMTITPTLRPKAVTYDVLRDFDPIGMVSSQPLVVVVPSSSPIKSIDDLVAAARAKPDALTAANSGNGSLAHLTTELFCAKVGVSIISVPYRGESAITPDLLSDRVSLGFLNLPVMLPLIRDGKLRALAVTTPQPSPDLPGVKSLRELGIEGVEAEGWAALFAAKGIPEEGLARLEQLLDQALRSQQVRDRFKAFGVAPVISGRAKLKEFIAAETERWSQVIKTRGIKAD
ncbi:tripartite tricarboxylate transporter substrate binding protein [Xanthobacteraceae bacterium Astr-EGSB]|uniref:Bug family tripartite tricarboxylate transporter substrate binding protein n=1 Tax=Astrobacterium formosum TaxID=3069710 RepID=UPI0027B71367|nr:tripartite tricarboxylate transporter substrate binding protein [Xanthobacteraceae bacterium Astr-EGSB]